ncbi:MAG: DUF86 domain-containing protein [Leptospirales bacterium]
MQLNYVVYLNDILASLEEIDIYIKDINSFTDYSADKKTIRAVERNLEIIGEAVKKLPESLREEYTKTEWRKIAGLRDMLIHGYSEIDDAIIWEIVQNKLPNLRNTVTQILHDKE